MREERASQTDEAETPGPAKLHVSPIDGAAGDTFAEGKRSRASRLTAQLQARSRSRSRHSAVTDKGQATSSLEDVSRLAPPVPGLAEATRIAPERKLSQLSSTETSTNASVSAMSPPGVVISDHPQSPATLIPPTDGSSTRPTKGGIAYPFSLKVNGADDDARNASMLTLQSLNVATPPAVEVSLQDKQSVAPAKPLDEENIGTDDPSPRVERHHKAGTGAGLFSDGVEADPTKHAEKSERPPVERFETAYEDLSPYLKGKAKE